MWNSGWKGVSLREKKETEREKARMKKLKSFMNKEHVTKLNPF